MKTIISFFALILFAFLTLGFIRVNKIRTVNSNKPVNYILKDSTKAIKKENIGIGPIKELKLGPINQSLVKEGKNIFNSKCFACHRLDSKLVGPALIPIVKKTSPVYLMNYLLNTTEMQNKEPELKKLVKEYNNIAMPNQNLNENQARAVLEYLRSNVKEK